MAETYKGLTIRIGGDTTGLQKSLKSVTSSIAATENQLRRMKSALNMDSGSTSAINKALDLMGNKAIETNRKVLQLKSGLDQIANQKVRLFDGTESVQTVKQLAELTADANQRAADAKENYAAITAELAKFYRPINEAVDATGKLDGELDEAKQAVREFSKAWSDAHDGKGFSTSKLIDEEGFDSAIQKLKELGLMTDEQEAKLRDLRKVYGDAFDENEIAKMVAQFEDGNVEVEKLTASAKAATKQFSELSRAAMMSKYGEGIDDSLGHIENAAKSLENELKQIDDALRFDPHNVDLLAQKMRDLQESSNLAQSKVETLEEKLRRLSADGADKLAADMTDVRLEVEKTAQAYDDVTAQVKQLEGAISAAKAEQSKFEARGDDLSDEYQEAKSRVKQLEDSLKSLRAEQERTESAFKSAKMAEEFVETRTQVERARSEVSRYNNELQEMKRFSGVTAGSLTSLGMSLSTSVTPTLIAAGWGIVQSAQDIDTAYRDMRKTVNGTEQDFESLRQAAIDFSTTNVTSADQMLSIQAIGGELGVATEDLQTFAETVSNLDVATNLDAEEAATALGQLRNILNLTGEDLGPFSDAIVRLGNNGASTETQIVDIAKRIGSMGAIVGMSAPDILAWSSAIASTGQNAEAAGTAISNTMSDIETAVSAGGDKLQGFADVARMTAEEFAAAWNENPTVALKAFIEGLNSIEESGGSADATLGDLGITAARQKQAIMGLMQTIDGLGDSLEMSNDAFSGVSDQWGEAGDAAREAEAKAEGFSGSLSRLQNIAQAAGAELGESLVPIIDGVADVLGDLYEQFDRMPDSTKQTIVAIGALAAALGPMILLGKGISEFFGGIAGGLQKLGAAAKAARQVKGLSGAFDLLSKSAGGLSGVLSGGLVAVGIAAAVGGIAALVAHFQDAAEEARLTERATKGLSDACGLASADMSDASDEAFNYSETLRDVSEANDDTIESLAKLADEFDEINTNTSGTLYRLESAKSAVENFGGRADLSAKELGELKSAVDYLNESCGTNYQVVKDSGGAYQIMEDGAVKAKDAIYDLIEAQEIQAQKSAQQSKLDSLYEQRAPAEEAYIDALDAEQQAYEEYIEWKRKFDKARSEGNEAYDLEVKMNEAMAHWQELAGIAEEQGNSLALIDDDIAKVNGTLGNLEEVASGAVEGMEAFVKQNFSDLFEADEDAIQGFVEALNKAGVSVSDLEKMSSQDLTRFANNWKNTGNDVSSILAEMGIDLRGMSENIRSTFDNMDLSGSVTDKLTSLGFDLDQLSLAMSNAGITSGQLLSIGSENFKVLAENAEGDVNRMIWAIQNYNGTNLLSKSADLSANPAQLIDAQNRIYTWNGTELKTITGETVVDYRTLELANDEVLEWNSEGLPTINGTALADYEQIELANGEFLTWDGTYLRDQHGNVYVDDLELEDALGNMVTFRDFILGVITGEVDVDDSSVTNAIANLNNLSRYNGMNVNTSVTTTYRTRGATAASLGRPGQLPYSLGPDDYGTGGGTPVITWPSAASTLASRAATLNDGISLMSSEATKAARSISKAPWAIARTATELARSSAYAVGTSSVRQVGSSGVGTVNNYYIGDTEVTTMTDREFADAFVTLMDRFGRLAKT